MEVPMAPNVPTGMEYVGFAKSPDKLAPSMIPVAAGNNTANVAISDSQNQISDLSPESHRNIENKQSVFNLKRNRMYPSNREASYLKNVPNPTHNAYTIHLRRCTLLFLLLNGMEWSKME